jgi:aldose 1-epimerase
MGREDRQLHAIVLRAGMAQCEIWPDAGGSIARWTIDQQDMFRRTPASARKDKLPLGMSSFPLVPYSNRIGYARFDYHGRIIELEPNFPPEPHAIHGTGWTAPWQSECIGCDRAILHFIHEPDRHWPWKFEAEQHISLSPDGLRIELIVRNLSDQKVPLAFGHHPYFDSTGATLSFEADQLWRNAENGLPAYAERPKGQFDFASGAAVTGRVLDNGYAGWNGKAQIAWAGRPRRLEISSDMKAAVVYIPGDEDYFCFEPVPHIINALNMPDHQPQMRAVSPGACIGSEICFETTML